MSRDILDQIDHVLADYGTGPDAMRWTPEPQEAAPSQPPGFWHYTWPTGINPGPRVISIDPPLTLEPGMYVLAANLETVSVTRVAEYTAECRTMLRGPWRGRVRPLAIDGDAYRRRQKARRKRR